MSFEIRFFPIGEKTKSGDAIVIRYWSDLTEQKIIVIDGGNSENESDLIINIINKEYKSNDIELIISTHLDSDHIGGLPSFIKRMNVKKLWIHTPATHNIDEKKLDRIINSYKYEVITASAKQSENLIDLAKLYGVEIEEPFTGTKSSDQVLTVLGPTLENYEIWMNNLINSYDPNYSKANPLLASANPQIQEDFINEALTDGGTTSGTNNSSVITLFEFDGNKMLFTGDAGMPALGFAADVLESKGISPHEIALVQVPHHGSRHNVGPTILNRILGPKGQESCDKTAVVSCSIEGYENHHPNNKVTNAFIRRGYETYSTCGSSFIFSNLIDEMNGKATPISFVPLVEEDIY